MLKQLQKIPMLEQIQAILFDLDGTLVDSMWVWTAIDEQFLKTHHLQMPKDFHKGMEGKSYSETAQYFLDTFPSLPHTKEALMDEWYEMTYETYANEISLKKGAYEFLHMCHENGIKLGLATSNKRELAEANLKANGVLQWFDCIWTSCEAKVGKPAPDVYLKAAAELQVEPQHCLVFEDVPMGILAGKNAGMKVCAVEDDFSKPQEEKKRALADYYIQDYDDIKNNTYEILKKYL